MKPNEDLLKKVNDDKELARCVRRWGRVERWQVQGEVCRVYGNAIKHDGRGGEGGARRSGFREAYTGGSGGELRQGEGTSGVSSGGEGSSGSGGDRAARSFDVGKAAVINGEGAGV